MCCWLAAMVGEGDCGGGWVMSGMVQGGVRTRGTPPTNIYAGALPEAPPRSAGFGQARHPHQTRPSPACSRRAPRRCWGLGANREKLWKRDGEGRPGMGRRLCIHQLFFSSLSFSLGPSALKLLFKLCYSSHGVCKRIWSLALVWQRVWVVKGGIAGTK